MFRIPPSPSGSENDSSDSEQEKQEKTRPKRRPNLSLLRKAASKTDRNKRLGIGGSGKSNDIVVENPRAVQLDDTLDDDLEIVEDKEERVKKMMAKSVIGPGFEKSLNMTPVVEGKRAVKRQRKEARCKTKGSQWFDMPATEMTDERKRDLEIIRHRNVLDPKRFYKSNDMNALPKYFQIGTVVGTSADYYDTVPKKQRKRTIADELLSDFAMQQKFKKKYKTLQAEKYKNQPKMFRNKGKKKKK